MHTHATYAHIYTHMPTKQLIYAHTYTIYTMFTFTYTQHIHIYSDLRYTPAVSNTYSHAHICSHT